MPYHSTRRHATPCYAMLDYTTQCHTALCYATLRYTTLHYTILDCPRQNSSLLIANSRVQLTKGRCHFWGLLAARAFWVFARPLAAKYSKVFIRKVACPGWPDDARSLANPVTAVWLMDGDQTRSTPHATHYTLHGIYYVEDARYYILFTIGYVWYVGYIMWYEYVTYTYTTTVYI